MISFWDLYSIVYDSLPNHFQPYQALVQDVVNEVAKHSKKGKLLDAGCGTGNFCLALAKEGYEVVGVDSSERMLKRALIKQRKAGIRNITLVRSNLEQLSNFPDDCFDTLICVNALYSVRDPKTVIQEYYRVLRPDGRFIMCEPQHQFKLRAVIKEANIRGGWKEVINVVSHFFILGLFNLVLSNRQSKGLYHYWSADEAKKTLGASGFLVESAKLAYTANVDILINSLKIPKCRGNSSDYDTRAAIISSV